MTTQTTLTSLELQVVNVLKEADHYEEMPKEVEQKVIEEYKKSREEEN